MHRKWIFLGKNSRKILFWIVGRPLIFFLNSWITINIFNLIRYRVKQFIHFSDCHVWELVFIIFNFFDLTGHTIFLTSFRSIIATATKQCKSSSYNVLEIVRGDRNFRTICKPLLIFERASRDRDRQKPPYTRESVSVITFVLYIWYCLKKSKEWVYWCIIICFVILWQKEAFQTSNLGDCMIYFGPTPILSILYSKSLNTANNNVKPINLSFVPIVPITVF